LGGSRSDPSQSAQARQTGDPRAPSGARGAELDAIGAAAMTMPREASTRIPDLPAPVMKAGPDALQSPVAGGLPRLADHTHCCILSSMFRGALCEQLATAPPRRFTTGEFLYHIGADAHSVFLLRRGLVKVSVVSSGGQETTLRIYKPGDVFGELCLCTNARREQAIALEESDVVEIPIERFLARLRDDPAAALDFATTACERLAEAHERLRSLAVDPVLGRLVRTLLALANEIGEATADGKRLPHHLAQDELAQLIGARREVVSTLLNRLRGKGLLNYVRGGYIQIDCHRLERLSTWLEAEGSTNPMLAR
jgi:CRP/FNR family transcriptional regulator, cyclic AMP receptor protein